MVLCKKNAHGSETQEGFGAVRERKCGKEGEERGSREKKRKKGTRKEEVDCDALSIRDTSHQSSEENVETLLFQTVETAVKLKRRSFNSAWPCRADQA